MQAGVLSQQAHCGLAGARGLAFDRRLTLGHALQLLLIVKHLRSSEKVF